MKQVRLLTFVALVVGVSLQGMERSDDLRAMEEGRSGVRGGYDEDQKLLQGPASEVIGSEQGDTFAKLKAFVNEQELKELVITTFDITPVPKDFAAKLVDFCFACPSLTAIRFLATKETSRSSHPVGIAVLNALLQAIPGAIQAASAALVVPSGDPGSSGAVAQEPTQEEQVLSDGKKKTIFYVPQSEHPIQPSTKTIMVDASEHALEIEIIFYRSGDASQSLAKPVPMWRKILTPVGTTVVTVLGAAASAGLTVLITRWSK